MHSTRSTSNIDSLPNVLKKYLLEFLGGQEVIKFTRISQKWLVMSTDPQLWKQINKRELPNDLMSTIFRFADLQVRTAHPYLQYSIIKKPDYIFASISGAVAFVISLYQNVQWKAEKNRIVNFGITPLDTTKILFEIISIPVSTFVHNYQINISSFPNSLKEYAYKLKMPFEDPHYENGIPSITLELSQKFKKQQEAKPGEEDKNPAPSPCWYNKKYSLAGIGMFVKQQIAPVALTQANEMTQFIKFISG